jgi:hypothetical protein
VHCSTIVGNLADPHPWATRPECSLRLKIRIENPTPGGARFTSAAKARFYELQGSAKLSTGGKRLHFLESHYRKQSAELSARETADHEYRLSACGYDRRGILTLNEIAKIPVVRPAVLVTIPKKARSQPRRNGKVKILVQDGVPVYRAPVVSIEVGRKAGKMRENAETPKAA